MSDFSPELQQLFRATGQAGRPTDADRERVFNGLQSRLGITVAAGTGGAVGATVSRGAGRTLTGKTVTFALAALSLVVGGVVLMEGLTRRQAPEVVSSPNSNVVLSAAQSTSDGTQPSAAESQGILLQATSPATTSSQPKAATSLASSRRTAKAHDTLAEEAAILSRAQSELHLGRATTALQVLAEHERKFKRGILAQERVAVKIQALCALGRSSEANALMGRLSAQSLTGDSARQACSSSKNAAAH